MKKHKKLTKETIKYLRLLRRAYEELKAQHLEATLPDQHQKGKR